MAVKNAPPAGVPRVLMMCCGIRASSTVIR
jgi:hypothetical protein